MFTPPPSPGRAPEKASQDVPPTPESPDTIKRRIGRRTKWTVIMVPMALLLITASTRYLTHPAAFDIFSDPPALNWETLSARTSDWAPHEAHLRPRQVSSASTQPLSVASFPSVTGSASSTASSTATIEPSTSDQTVPTIPASSPNLPTPFPQPFDSQLSQNFSTVSCFEFFSNMTNTVAFRSCRPFSLLLQSSEAFIDVSVSFYFIPCIR